MNSVHFLHDMLIVGRISSSIHRGVARSSEGDQQIGAAVAGEIARGDRGETEAAGSEPARSLEGPVAVARDDISRIVAVEMPISESRTRLGAFRRRELDPDARVLSAPYRFTPFGPSCCPRSFNPSNQYMQSSSRRLIRYAVAHDRR